jgi:hypothetical protein
LVERINEEFRRRTKTQASLRGEDAALLLLYGLLVAARSCCGASTVEVRMPNKGLR